MVVFSCFGFEKSRHSALDQPQTGKAQINPTYGNFNSEFNRQNTGYPEAVNACMHDFHIINFVFVISQLTPVKLRKRSIDVLVGLVRQLA